MGEPVVVDGVSEQVRFPDGFLWGAATSSHQIEGGRAGRSEDAWDRFSTRPGAIVGGDVAGDACDHLRLMADDVALMADLGLHAYRFSISWARVASGGGWRATPAGLDPYRRLVDLLGEAGIAASATLYHWDHPQELEAAGGWRHRDTAVRFAEYAADVAAALGAGVAQWATLNEPWCVAFLGHAAGEHTPGLTDPAAAVAAAHHLLLGHGLAIDALRAAAATQLASCSTRRRWSVTSSSTRTCCAASTARSTASSSTRCCAGATPTTCSPISARGCRRCVRAISPRSPARSTGSA